MIFYRSPHKPRELPVTTARTLSLGSLVAYPVGALVLTVGPATLATSLVGYALIVGALIACAPLLGSSLQRVVGEEVKVLDEFELRLRGRAMGIAYAVFTGLTLLAVMYAAVASDKGGWFPKSYGEFSGLFWGVFLYSVVLPIAALSWIVEPSFNDEGA